MRSFFIVAALLFGIAFDFSVCHYSIFLPFGKVHYSIGTVDRIGYRSLVRHNAADADAQAYASELTVFDLADIRPYLFQYAVHSLGSSFRQQKQQLIAAIPD